MAGETSPPPIRHEFPLMRAATSELPGERKVYLSNLPPDTGLMRLASVIKARRVREQAHRPKEELGRDRFEGRSWRSCTGTRSWR